MLIKNLYGMFRDEGYSVEITDDPAHAVRIILENRFLAVIIDSQAFGLSAEEAVQIIKTVSPEIRVILIGCREYEAADFSINLPLDLEALKKLVRGMRDINTISHN